MANGSGTLIGRPKQLSLNRFFDPSTPSMRKGRDGENGGRKKIMVKIVAELRKVASTASTLEEPI